MHVWSVTKSVVSALIGIAIDEKIISGLDTTLPELLPRYQKYLSTEEKSITLRQLMYMTAGFPPDDPAPFENIHSVFRKRTDPVPMILTDGLDLPPGHVTHVAGAQKFSDPITRVARTRDGTARC